MTAKTAARMMMGLALALSCVAAACTGMARAADVRPLEEKARVGERKGEVLEEKAAPDGDKKAPTPAEAITPPEAAALDPKGRAPLDEALTCLARTVYWEAKGESRAGMEAIANVVMNRVAAESFPDTVCEVVTDGKKAGACQFSWWCDGRPDDVEEPECYAVAIEIARLALNRELPDRSSGALHFHSGKVPEGWSKELVETVQVGDHRFYKPRSAEGR